MWQKKNGQTFALVHLIELILGIMVLAIIGLGIVSMVSGIRYYQEFYAKDTALLIEAMHSLPNGDADIGYLWEGKDYVMEVETGKVTVNKTKAELWGLVKGTGYDKKFGTGAGTTIVDANIVPRYVRFVSKGEVEKTLQVQEGLVPRGCPDSPMLSGIQKAGYGFPSVDSVGSGMADRILASVRQQNSALSSSGVKILVLYQSTSQQSITIYDKAQTDVTARLSCTIEAEGIRSGYPAVRGSLSALPSNRASIDTDIIIAVTGVPNDFSLLEASVAKGILAYGDGSDQVGGTQ